MNAAPSFKGHSIVSCGTLRPELEHLQRTGFLDRERLLFTAPGLHENCPELERQLLRQLDEAREFAPHVIVVYGSRCYVHNRDVWRTLDRVLEEQPRDIARIDAANCVDMLASKEQRDEIAGEDAVYWLTPGWLRYWKAIFKHWDAGKANETFPRDGKAVLLDGLGIYDQYIEESPEKLLEFSDWMKIPIVPHEVGLDRLRRLLVEPLRAGER